MLKRAGAGLASLVNAVLVSSDLGVLFEKRLYRE